MAMTTEQREIFQAAFDMFDVDGSGAVSVDELGSVMKKLNGDEPFPDEEVRGLVKKYDADNSGQINFNEFCELMLEKLNEAAAKGPSAEEVEARLRSLWMRYDRDASGRISKEEVYTMVLAEYGEKITEEEAEELIREVDTDGDGQIGCEEFYAYFGEMMMSKYK